MSVACRFSAVNRAMTSRRRHHIPPAHANNTRVRHDAKSLSRRHPSLVSPPPVGVFAAPCVCVSSQSSITQPITQSDVARVWYFWPGSARGLFELGTRSDEDACQAESHQTADADSRSCLMNLARESPGGLTSRRPSCSLRGGCVSGTGSTTEGCVRLSAVRQCSHARFSRHRLATRAY